MSTPDATTEAPALAREATRDLILILADSKRLLGMRYAEWLLGAPELEAGIACASMAQDEWGHARLLYAMLKDFGDDVDSIEHGREPRDYRNIEVLDASPENWPQLVALNALVDTALTVQLESLRASSHTALRQRVEKLLEEERFHAAHGTAWFRRLARSGGRAQEALRQVLTEISPTVLRWFGPDSARARALQDASVTDAAGSALRARYLERIAPLVVELSAPDVLSSIEPGFDDFDEASRRVTRDGPDAATIARVRGDKNRAFLMD